MPKVIICDTSCFIILNNIGELEILRSLYGTIVTTSIIASEYGDSLPDWIIIEDVKDASKQKLLELQIDKGEASAIALALEKPGSTIILDDNKARKVARQLNLVITGTIGILVKAKLQGIIPSVRTIFDKVKQTNFRITEEIEKAALKEAGE
ncbi:MAG: DUF3368 domain-containing protein [Sphingobacteriaceae bacterium]|nr:MAG: DUF3368 domain-containing protein [Sphingobacteriaceae bacterium]